MIKKILVLSRKGSSTDLLNALLAERYNLEMVHASEEVLNWMDQGNVPDLILLDADLPENNNLNLVKNLRNRVINDIPVLVLTFENSFDKVIELLKGGANDYLSSPFEVNELFFRLDQLLKNTRSRKAVLREINKRQAYAFF